MIKALAVILVPLLCGALFVLVESPPRAQGAYVQLEDGMYALPSCDATGSAVSATAPAVTADVRSFFLVSTKDNSDDARAAAARLYFRVVNHAAPDADYGRTPVATAAHKLNARVHKIDSAQRLQWEPAGLTNTIYQEALTKIPGNRATAELLLELDVPSTSGTTCRYGVVLGPSAGFAEHPVKWFVPPAEKR